ncbi:hypothetical protein HHI36_014231, partial [Cryptolaemus montrouzieri]
FQKWVVGEDLVLLGLRRSHKFYRRVKTQCNEEERFDDENLPTNLPNDVPGNIEVFIRDEGALSDSSDDEPLAFKRARIRSSLSQDTGDHSTNSTNPVWRKCDSIYNKTYMESDTRLLNE